MYVCVRNIAHAEKASYKPYHTDLESMLALQNTAQGHINIGDGITVSTLYPGLCFDEVSTD